MYYSNQWAHNRGKQIAYIDFNNLFVVRDTLLAFIPAPWNFAANRIHGNCFNGITV